MNTQQDDVRDLIKAIHDERLAAKEKEKRESRTRSVSLMIVTLAVLTGIGSLKSGQFSSKLMFNQALAAGQWV